MMSFHYFMTTSLVPLQNLVRLFNFSQILNTTNIFIRMHMLFCFFQLHSRSSTIHFTCLTEFANSHGSLNIFRFFDLRNISCKYTVAMVFFIFIERNGWSISFTANTGATASDRSRGNRRRGNRSRMSVSRHSVYEVANEVLGPPLRSYEWTSRYENDLVLESTGYLFAYQALRICAFDIVSTSISDFNVFQI